MVLVMVRECQVVWCVASQVIAILLFARFFLSRFISQFCGCFFLFYFSDLRLPASSFMRLVGIIKGAVLGP